MPTRWSSTWLASWADVVLTGLRSVVVPAEDRTLQVDAEDRTLQVAPEDRTLQVTA